MPVTAGRLAALAEAYAQLPHELRVRFASLYDVSVPSALGSTLPLLQTPLPAAAGVATGCANQPHVFT